MFDYAPDSETTGSGFAANSGQTAIPRYPRPLPVSRASRSTPASIEAILTHVVAQSDPTIADLALNSR